MADSLEQIENSANTAALRNPQVITKLVMSRDLVFAIPKTTW
jgi:hypothetical protein